jgi:FAD/FMN-containing dehydrogenase
MGWGRVSGGDTQVFRPESRHEVVEALREAADSAATLGLRGAGCSYGDASLNTGGLLLDLSRMNRVLAFDDRRGEALVEPGLTIRELWRQAIPRGLWPAVVPGTMAVSCGGAAAMNIHGKNNFAVGVFGDHVLEITLITPSGEALVCSREQNRDVFHAAIGGFGMLGVIVEMRVALKRVHSGRMQVTAIASADLETSLGRFEAELDDCDYLVGWLDLHARGRSLGRGVIHRANHLAQGEDPEGETMLRPEMQELPSRLFRVFPKSWLWPGMWTLLQAGLVPVVNAARYHAGIRESTALPQLRTHAEFHFLLDYAPNWKKMTSPGGLIQFQPFVPKEEAAEVFRSLIEMCHEQRLVPYLGVLKRHRPDPFLMTHAVEGYSLAMDFAVRRRQKQRLWELCRRMADSVLEKGGRFYYAKDTLLTASSFERIHGAAAVEQFRALKERLDPKGVLSTDLSRRLLVRRVRPRA